MQSIIRNSFRVLSENFFNKGVVCYQAPPASYTTTNVQELGVDEENDIKNDEKYIYEIRGDKIVIFQAWPPEEFKILAEIPALPVEKLETPIDMYWVMYSCMNKSLNYVHADSVSYIPNSLFLHDNRLIIIDNMYYTDKNKLISMTSVGYSWGHGGHNLKIAPEDSVGIGIRIFDISVPEKPVLIRQSMKRATDLQHMRT